MSARKSKNPRPKNQRACFRTRVPAQLSATAVLELSDGELPIAIVELSLANDGQSGGLRLGPPGSAARRLQALEAGDAFALRILLPAERPLTAAGSLLRWVGVPPRPILSYQLGDRRGEEPLRRFWAACQRHFLLTV